ncbi:MAG: quinol:cytochrome C oxidoreductase [Chitinophagales bacterium]
MSEMFSFTNKEKKFSFILLGVGMLLAAIGLFTNLDNPTRLWTGLMYNHLFFMIIGLVAAFFVASQTIGYNGWYVLIKRIPEAMMMYVPFMAIPMFVILFFGFDHIYHWGDPAVVAHDKLLQGKAPYLNAPFFFGRAIAYLALWSGLIFLLRKNSVSTDTNPDLKIYTRSKHISALFILVFAVTSSTYSWDWLMSIQPHWYSTLWGWYCFISVFVTCMSIVYLVVRYLQSQGYLKDVNQEHYHDLGKYMFAFSVAWAYLFYSQFMLIWYANIPEETAYFKLRIDEYPVVMYLCIVINFILPFFLLITTPAKRRGNIMIVAAILIIIGHWLDFFQMSVPGALESMHAEHIGFVGFYEIGLGLMYAGLFIFLLFRNLATAQLVQENHPFAKESVVHHT